MGADGDKYGLLDDPKVRKLEELPEDWEITEHTFTQPNGWRWANNGKTLSSGERETALVREARLWQG